MLAATAASVIETPITAATFGPAFFLAGAKAREAEAG
jgi:hypothetical protein